MKKIVVRALYLMLIISHAMAQSHDAIVKKYQNDTTGFIAYPYTFLLKGLKPAGNYKELEINTWVSLYADRTTEYRNVCRYPASPVKKPDTVVLSKCNLSKCFAAFNGPLFTPWYLSAETRKNQVITIENDTIALKTFLGKANNQFNAYFWLVVFNTCHLSLYESSSEIPVEIPHNVTYKKVHGGFLIRCSCRISNCPITTAKLTYFVGDDFRIILLNKQNISVYQGCT